MTHTHKKAVDVSLAATIIQVTEKYVKYNLIWVKLSLNKHRKAKYRLP